MAQPYQLVITTDSLQILLGKLSGPFRHPQMAGPLADGVRKWGMLFQARAVRNVTGYPVSWSGGVFRVMVRTGTLRSSIELQYPYQSRFQARVFVNGTYTNEGQAPGGKSHPRPVSAYANSIEDGHGEIDLKKTMLGKTVPFFASLTDKTRGPFIARGLEPMSEATTGIGSQWRSRAHDQKLAAIGKGPMPFTKQGGGAAFKTKGSTSYYIAFRKVGRTGWVIPAAAPRPFMRAALEGTAEQGRLLMVKTIVNALQADGLA